MNRSPSMYWSLQHATVTRSREEALQSGLAPRHQESQAEGKANSSLDGSTGCWSGEVTQCMTTCHGKVRGGCAFPFVDHRNLYAHCIPLPQFSRFHLISSHPIFFTSLFSAHLPLTYSSHNPPPPITMQHVLRESSPLLLQHLPD